jgi:hypothetical protein
MLIAPRKTFQELSDWLNLQADKMKESIINLISPQDSTAKERPPQDSVLISMGY